MSALLEAWRQVIDRHPILRTSFRWRDLPAPEQRVHERAELPVEHHDLRDLSREDRSRRLEEILAEDRRRGFAFDEPPCMRLLLLRTGEETWSFIWSFHHLLLDGRSFFTILSELFLLYDAKHAGTGPELPDHASFGDWVRWLHAQDLTGAERHFRTLLEGTALPTPLGVDRSEPLDLDEASISGRVTAHLSEELTGRLRSVAKESGATIDNIVQAAWAILLGRYSGRNDVVFGATRAGRHGTTEGADSVVGMTINTVPVRASVSPDGRLGDLLGALREQWVALRAHEHAPLTRIQEWAGLRGGTPLFETLLVAESYDWKAVLRDQGGPWLEREVEVREWSNYPLMLLVDLGREIVLSVEHDRRRIDDATAARLLDHLRVLFEAMAIGGDIRIGDLGLSSPEERHRLLHAWSGAEASVAEETTLDALFEAQVARNPAAPAVQDGDRVLSYGELAERVHRLAHLLRREGVGPDTPVGMCLDRSADVAVAVLGILEAGGAWLPLDPGYPRERLTLMLGEGKVPVVVTHRGLSAVLPESGARLVQLDADAAELDAEPADRPSPVHGPGHVACVIYTSGSTGTPKGVLLEHRALANNARVMAGLVGLGPDDRMPSSASLSFDLSNPRALRHLGDRRDGRDAPRGRAVHGAARRVARARAHHGHVYADGPLARVGARSGRSRRDRARSSAGRGRGRREGLGGGVPCLSACRSRAGTLDQHLRSDRVRRRCGHVGAAPRRQRPGGARRRAGGTTHCGRHSLRARGARCAHAPRRAGRALHRRRVRRARLPRASRAHGRAFRAGDVPRGEGNAPLSHRRSGALDGRRRAARDRTPRRSGEGARLPGRAGRGAGRARRSSRGAAGGGLGAPGGRPDQAARRLGVARIRARADGRGPSSLPFGSTARVHGPDGLRPRGHLPLSPNGKVDRARLPDPRHASGDSARDRVPPRNPTEELLAGVFAEVLGASELGVHDDFFELGGDSLLSLRVIDRAMHAGLHISADTLFRYPTVAKLARVVRTSSAGRDGDWSCLVALRTTGTRPPLFLVHTTPGDVLGYARLVRRLGPDQPCYGLQSLGLYDPTLAHHTIEAMARHYIAQMRLVQPRGPYFLAGWCYGGMVAFEMAGQLLVRGEQVGMVALIEAMAPWPGTAPAAMRYAGEIGRALWEMGPTGWSDWVMARARRVGVDERTSSEILAVEIGEGPLANRNAVSQMNMQAFRMWRPRYYDGTLTILRGTEPRPGTIDHPTLRWSPLARKVDCHTVPGAHHEVLHEPNVPVLAAYLQAAMDRVLGRREAAPAMPYEAVLPTSGVARNPRD